MDGDIKFGGVSTKEKILLVVGERMNWENCRVLPTPVGKTLQFGSNLEQNQKTLYLIILSKKGF